MPPFVFLWVWLCAGLHCAGWGLSALHALNVWGYSAVLLSGLGAGLLWRRQSRLPAVRPGAWSRLIRRFRRPLPLAFLILTSLAFLGGAWYEPSNFDGMTYREPRILNWLAAGQWHWIHTLYPRVNARACGVEWISTPLILFFRTDRLLFLINVVSFLLLPGLVYSVFTRLGVRRRVAWHWMWVVPTGYCFILQAGSSGNDLFGAPFVLAAVDFALRARTSRSAGDFFAAILAAALMTSAKTSDLPLLLVWGVAMLPSWPLVFRWPVKLALVCLVAFACSFLPTALLNVKYCGDWSGWKSEGVCAKSDPPLRLAANIGLVTLQNLTPPVFPFAKNWNALATNHLSRQMSLRLHQTVVENEAAEFQMAELQIEENAGLGFGVVLLVLLSWLAALGRPGAPPRTGRNSQKTDWWQTSLRWLPLVSLLALLTQSEVFPISRILAPYYALLLPVFLAGPGQAWVVRQRWWQVAVSGVYLLAALLLVVSPPRPLFPASRVIAALQAWRPEAAWLDRVNRVYAVYHERSHAFDPALGELPPDLKTLGLFTYDDPEASLWRPFGSRRIVHVRPDDTADYLKREGVQYILLAPMKPMLWSQVTPAEWVRSVNATIVKKIPLHLRASEGFREWWLVKLP